MNLTLMFIIITVSNVIMSTIKNIITVKGGKLLSSLANAFYYGFYTVVVVYTMCDLPLWEKMVITAIANFVGVYIVKYLDEKLEKEKLWKIEATIPTHHANNADMALDSLSIPHSFIKVSPKHTVFNIYCATRAESSDVKKLIGKYGAKYFVSESKKLY